MRHCVLGSLLMLSLVLSAAASSLRAGETPRAVDGRLKVELFAEHPDIVTPTGIDVDHAGRVWAIESNTHFRPDGYDRHPSDRVLVLEDTDGDRRADRITPFADGLTHAMSVAVRPVWLEPVRPVKPATTPGNDSTASGKPAAPPLQVFVATRRAIWLYTDEDHDLRPERKERIIRLDSRGDYPHNGLAGFAFDALGWMYFGFGENLGEPYTLVGSGGTTLSGGGEGGNLYRCRPDGTQLQQWATGFWNPHASCVDAYGRLFTVDNDADSRPPCRLLHVIEGGDYGFRFRNGRKGLHPFTSWNGEVPGTLPMVAGTGEAPGGIVAYESDGLPEDYRGTLLVTSWGDHRIERYRLTPKGASFTSRAEPVVQGGEDFRPVGIALAPDGSLYCTDWVQKDYHLHGHGRIWRISAKDGPERQVIDAAAIWQVESGAKLESLMMNPRLDVRRAAARNLSDTLGEDEFAAGTYRTSFLDDRRAFYEWTMARFRTLAARRKQSVSPQDSVTAEKHPEEELWRLRRLGVQRTTGPFFLTKHVVSWVKDRIPVAELIRAFRGASPVESIDRPAQEQVARMRLVCLLAGRRLDPKNVTLARLGFDHPDGDLRRLAVQWVAEENLEELRPQVEAVLESGGLTPELFLASLAALEMLDGKSPQEFDRTPPTEYLVKLLRDERRPARLRAMTLRMLPSGAAGIDVPLLRRLVSADDAELRLEAVRTLQTDPSPPAQELLRELAADQGRDVDLRAEAVLGLAAPGGPLSQETVHTLSRLFHGESEALQVEAMRSLRAETAAAEGLRKILYDQVHAEDAPKHLRREEVSRQLDLILEKTFDHRFDVAKDLDPRLAGGDAAAGRRVFFHPMSTGCSGCHTVNGRGGRIGPDLSVIASTMDRRKLAGSIVKPSQEVAPQWTAWTFATTDGRVHTGLILEATGDRVVLGTAEGKTITLSADEIAQRKTETLSIMPENLTRRLTLEEFRDLLAFLESLK